MEAVVDALPNGSANGEPPTSSIATPAPVTPGAAPTPRLPKATALRRAKEKVEAQVYAISFLRREHAGEFEVEFADAALKALQALIYGRCVPSTEIARLHRLSHDFAGEGEEAGTRAIAMVGGALRSLSIARNEAITLTDGFNPDEFGLPRLTVKPKKVFESDENTSPGGTQAVSRQAQQGSEQESSVRRVKDEPLEGGGEYPLFTGTTKPSDEERMNHAAYTTGFLQGPTGSVDVSKVPLPPRDDSEAEMEEEARRRRAGNRRKIYNPTAPPPSYELHLDADGNPIVKSEMLGDEEFFDYQVQMRDMAERYEAIAALGLYEERFIIRQLTGGRVSKVGKTYECDECGTVCPSQHKFAAHKRYAHPKTDAQRAAFAAAKANERATDRTERREMDKQRREGERRWKDEDIRRVGGVGGVVKATVITPATTTTVTSAAMMQGGIERQRRERRAPLPRDEPFSLAAAGKTSSTSPPADMTKIYTCPICTEVLDSQHKFASHMRYKHPKGSLTESMVGRRAAVTKVKTSSGSVPSSPLFPVSSTSTSTPSGATKMASDVSKMTPSEADEREQEENGEEERVKMFPCRICGRTFENINKLGGHTGHCLRANGLPPSGREGATKVTPSGASGAAPTSSLSRPPGAQTPPSSSTPTGAVRMYACHICGRAFDNRNAHAGHTRHCMKNYGLDVYPPSPLVPARTASPAPATSKTTSSAARKTSTASLPSGAEEMETEDEEQGEEAKAEKMYACHVCTRVFDNHNSLAGHTRHCMKANGVDPSPRALAQREKVAAAAAEAQKPPVLTPVARVAKKESMPMSPLAMAPPAIPVVTAPTATTTPAASGASSSTSGAAPPAAVATRAASAAAVAAPAATVALGPTPRSRSSSSATRSAVASGAATTTSSSSAAVVLPPAAPAAVQAVKEKEQQPMRQSPRKRPASAAAAPGERSVKREIVEEEESKEEEKKEEVKVEEKKVEKEKGKKKEEKKPEEKKEEKPRKLVEVKKEDTADAVEDVKPVIKTTNPAASSSTATTPAPGATAGPSANAAAAVSPTTPMVVKGKLTPPFSMSTRSSRSRATATPAPQTPAGTVPATSPSMVTPVMAATPKTGPSPSSSSTQPTPAKRARTESRVEVKMEVKDEPVEEGEERQQGRQKRGRKPITPESREAC